MKKTEIASPPQRLSTQALSGILVGILVLILIVWIVILYVVGGEDEVEPEAREVETSETPIGESSRPQPPRQDHRDELASATAALLTQARELGGSDDSSELFNEVAQGDESSLPKSFVSKFRIVDKLAEEEEIRSAALLAVLQLGQVLDRSLPADREIELLTDDASTYVYLDLEAGNAHVPLSLYLGPDAAFSFEYVWVEGRWVFSPYSFIDAVSAADIAASGATLSQD